MIVTFADGRDWMTPSVLGLSVTYLTLPTTAVGGFSQAVR